jgi:hypothetical protein
MRSFTALIERRLCRRAPNLGAIALALLAGALASPAIAQQKPAVGWTSLGPAAVSGWSGKVNAFAYVAKNPQIMYTGGGWGNTPRESPSQAGIYRTVDGGRHWVPIDSGLTNPDGTISSVVNGLWLDQAHAATVLASTEFGGTFRSTDGGNSWTNVDRTEATQFAQAGTTLYLATLRGIMRSTDDGATWTLSLPISGGATTVVTANGALLAGSASGDVYALAGGTWTKRGHPGTGAVHDLAIDPFRTTTVYANVDDATAWNQDLYASLDGGSTWTRVRGGWSLGAQAIAFSLVVPHRLYIGDDGSGTIFHITADGSAKAVLQAGAQLAGVDNRYIVPVPGADPADDACFNLMDQGLFFAARCSSGSAPSLDKTTSKSLAYDVTPGAGGVNLLVPLQDMGTGLSTNSGTAWHQLNNTAEGAESYLNPQNPMLCYFAHPDYGLYFSSDACASFTLVYSHGISSLAFLPGQSAIYAVTNADLATAQVSLSSNGGSTWSPSGWSFAHPYQVVVSPANAEDIVVATGTAQSPSHLYVTHDGGKTWRVATGLPTTTRAQIIGLDFPVHRFYAAFDPKTPGTILLCDHDPQTDDVILYRSLDDGASFTRTSMLAQPVPPRPWPQLIVPTLGEAPAPEIPYYATRFFGNRLAFNPAAAGATAPAVILTTRFGAFASYDIGAHWVRLDRSLIAHDFIGVKWLGGYVYLASFGQGVLKSDAPLQ